MNDLEHGRIYRIQSRNLLVGAWNSRTQGFIGVREKFGSLYLFEEYHSETGPPHGTARPIHPLGEEVVPEAELHEDSAFLFDLLRRLEEPVLDELRREEERFRLESESKRWAPQTKAEYDREQRKATVHEWHRAEQAKINLIEGEDERREAQKRHHREWVKRLAEAIKGE